MLTLGRSKPANRSRTDQADRAPGGPSVRPATVTAGRRGLNPALLALVALTLTSAAGFARVFSGRSWVVPAMVTALGVHLAAWGARRAGVRPGAAFAINAGGIFLLAIWTVIPSATAFGLPAPETFHTLHRVLQEASTNFTSVVAPVLPTNGFKLLAVWGVGVTAAIADALAFRARSSLQGMAPAFALFVVCCIFGRTSGRSWAVFLEVTALAGFLLIHHLDLHRATRVWFANRRKRATAAALTVGAVTTAGAVLAALVVTPRLPPTEGLGALGWRGGPGSGGTRQVESPIVSLHTRLVQQSEQPVFTVLSSVPSYWRLTTLDYFEGDVWQATNSYQGVGGRLPGAPRVVPPGTRQVTQQFQIELLDSIWLPLAFTPVSVKGGGTVSYDPQSGSLLSSHATSNGETYSVTSLEYLATLDPAKLAHIPPVTASHSLDRYLQLPALPAEISRLATEITAGQTTEYGKAMALQAYFHTSSFHYDLNPPDDGFGEQALLTFLFKTRDGYCQQFAGAYAVLARAIGLPTRLAVGFATGTPDGSGVYHVRDADAHTWPEVYFAGVGWVPFEPTKSNFQIPGTEGYAGNTTDAGTANSTSVPLSAGSSTNLPGVSLRTPAAGSGHAVSAPAPLHPSSSRPWALAVFTASVASLAAAGLLLTGVTALGRTLRWRRRRRRVGWRGGTWPGIPRRSRRTQSRSPGTRPPARQRGAAVGLGVSIRGARS